MSSASATPVLDTKRGKQILMLLLAVAFLDFIDASIVNVALPSIRADLGFTVRNLQWVLTGYLLTYGGLMLLGSLAVLGAVLITAGMLLLVYTIVEAPSVGWGDARTVAGFAGAAVILAVFAGYETKHRDPVFPFSIFRVRGLAAADVTMVAAMSGFYTMFLLITLYQQNVLGLGPLPAGAAYVPAALGVALSAGISTNLMARVGTR